MVMLHDTSTQKNGMAGMEDMDQSRICQRAKPW